MMRIRLDINGREIGNIGVWNTEEYTENEVRYQVHDLRGADGGRITDYPLMTEIWHDRSDGAAALTARVMNEIDEDRLDDFQ